MNSSPSRLSVAASERLRNPRRHHRRGSLRTPEGSRFESFVLSRSRHVVLTSDDGSRRAYKRRASPPRSSIVLARFPRRVLDPGISVIRGVAKFFDDRRMRAGIGVVGSEIGAAALVLLGASLNRSDFALKPAAARGLAVRRGGGGEGLDPLAPVRKQSTSRAAPLSSLSIGNIDTSGKADGLRARLSRFSFFSKSSTSPSPQQSARGAERGAGPEATMAPHEAARATAEEEESAVKPSRSGQRSPQPVLFLSHGSPMLLVQKGLPSRDFIVNLPKQLKKKPKAILVVSAHWDTTEPTVTCVQKNDTIHDFYGFPREFYKMFYNAPGDPQLAERTVQLLRAGGFPKAKVTETRGLDHGAWVPLILMYPNLDIPIVQLSVQYRKSGSHHYKLGRALAPLKDEDVLIIGSGQTTHNLRSMNFEGGPADPHTLGFDNWLNEALVEHRDDEVINFTEKAPYALEMHPTPDHFLPIIVALGAAGDDAKCKRIHSSIELRTMSMASFAWESDPSQAIAAAA